MALLSPRQKRIRRALCVFAALFLLVFGWYALSRLASPFRAVKLFSASTAEAAKAAPLTELRVIVYNIAHGRGLAAGNWSGGGRDVKLARLREIAALLAAEKPDVVVLNEVDFDCTWSGGVNQAEVIAREAGLPNRAEGRNIDASLPFFTARCGNAVLSRFPITDARLVKFPGYSALETLCAGRKKGLVCTLLLPGGRQVRLLAVHLEHRSEEVRIAGALVIQELAAGEGPPLLAAGDFNSTPKSYPGAAPDASGRTALSLLLDGGAFKAALRKAPQSADFTFPSSAPDRAIDWVLAPAAWRVAEHRAVDSTLSDHRPVSARIVME